MFKASVSPHGPDDRDKVRSVPRHVTRGFDREKLRQLRIERGWRPADLARAARVSPASIYAYESGSTAPQVHILAKVMQALGKPMDAVVLIDSDQRFPSYYRVMAGLTQPQLAAKAGLSTTQLRYIESAEVNMSDTMCEKIAQTLNVSETEYREAYENCRERPVGDPY